MTFSPAQFFAEDTVPSLVTSATITSAESESVEAQRGVVAANVASGPVYDSIPELSPEQAALLEENERQEPVSGPVLSSKPPATSNASDVLPTFGDGGPNALAARAASPTDGGEEDQAPDDFVFFQNTPNLSASQGFRSTINEPSVGTIDNVVFHTANWFASVSGDDGATFSYVSPYLTFPRTGDFSGGFCCDQRVTHDPERDMLLWYLQYNRTGTRSNDIGGVRIARANTADEVLSNTWTHFDFTPEDFGLGRGLWLDFPHMQVSDNFLYATSNVFTTTTDQFMESVMWRISLDDLEAGGDGNGDIRYDFWTQPQFSLALVNGATDTMYAASGIGGGGIRVFTQPENSTRLMSEAVTGLSTTFFAQHSCPGPDGKNWCARSDNRIQTGWVSGDELGFMWNSAAGTDRPQPFVRAAVLDKNSLTLLREPDVWSPDEAWHYPAMAVNARGDIAGTVANGSSTVAPTVQILIDDDIAPDATPWTAVFAAGGTTGDDAWGDYLAAQPDDDFPNTWIAAGYIRNAFGAIPYFFWFGRERDNPAGGGDPDADDQISEASARNPGDSFADTIDPAGDVDMVSFSVTDGQRLGFDIDRGPASTLDSYVRLFDASGNELASNDEGNNTGPTPEEADADSYLEFTFSTGGTYYVGVSSAGNDSYDALSGLEDDDTGSTGAYTLNLVDLGTEVQDANDQISEAFSMSVGDSVTLFTINPGADVDMFEFTVTNDQVVGFDIDRVASDGLDANIRLFDDTGVELASNDDGGNAGPAPEESALDSYLEFTFDTGGTYYLGVSASGNADYDAVTGLGDVFASSTGGFTLNLVDLTPTDPDDQIGEANATRIGGVETGFEIDDGGDVDMFVFNVLTDGQEVGFDIDRGTSSSLDSYIRLFDGSGDEIASNNDGGNAGPAPEESTLDSYLEFTFDTAGTYYLGVSASANDAYDALTGDGDDDSGSTGDYTLTITDLNPPTDPDDQISEATAASVGDSLTGLSVQLPGDVDMFSFSVGDDQTVAFDIDRDVADELLSYIRLFDGTGTELAFNSVGLNEGPAPEVSESDSYLQYTFTTAGTYYLGVGGWGNFGYDPVTGNSDKSSSTGGYTLNLVDMSLTDPDDQIGEANITVVGETLTGFQIDRADDVDMFAFNVTDGQEIAFDIDRGSASTLDSYLRLFNESGSELASNNDGGIAGPAPEESDLDSLLAFTFDSGGTYFLGVSAFGNDAYDAITGDGDDASGSTGDYTLNIVDLTPLDPDDQIGEANAVSVGDSITGFEIRLPGDVDMFSFSVTENQKVAFDIDRDPSDALDSYIRLFDGDGTELASNDFGSNAGPPPEEADADSYLEYTFATGGTYFLGVSGFGNFGYDAETGSNDHLSSTGAYNLNIVGLSNVVGRHIFYNNSSFDGNDAAGNEKDASAIAPDKEPLLPGQTATFANYTGYSRGVNGVMVDIEGLPGTPTAADFEFRVGNDNDPSGWSAAPAPQSIFVSPGAGDVGSDRVTIIWSDNVIEKQWIQVVVLATVNTGLVSADVHYWGNTPGETGDSATNAFVDDSDFAGTSDNARTFLDPAPLDDNYDMNRDAFVDGTDLAIVRDNATDLATALNLISVPEETGDSQADPLQLAEAEGERLDVNDDGQVTARDALIVINDLTRQSLAEGEQASQSDSPYNTDVNGDNRVSALDALAVINYLARAKSGRAESESLPVAQPPSADLSSAATEEADAFFAGLADEEDKITSAALTTTQTDSSTTSVVRSLDDLALVTQADRERESDADVKADLADMNPRLLDSIASDALSAGNPSSSPG